MAKIKLIEKDTDISSLEINKLDWDVVVNNEPFQVVVINDYVHTIGGQHGVNNLWMYPRYEEPTYENLVEYNGKGCGVCWGIKYEPHNYIRCKWGEAECFTAGGATITRNGKDFYFCNHGIDEARVKIKRCEDHPLDLNTIDYKEKMIGRKVWWRSEPAVITYYCDGQACVILKPDGIDKFTTPAEFADEGDDYYIDDDVKAEIFSEHIWWFRE
jgi:hypothetical protein